MNEDFVIRMRDVRAAKMCSGGSRMFFEKHSLDWNAFLKEGILASKLIETNDVLALKIVEITKKLRANNGRQ